MNAATINILRIPTLLRFVCIWVLATMEQILPAPPMPFATELAGILFRDMGKSCEIIGAAHA
jgi:hypothetical protein